MLKKPLLLRITKVMKQRQGLQKNEKELLIHIITPLPVRSIKILMN